ncbi:hypothetical protein [Mesorhizobium sp. J428]|uniref:hypothetical protein n=1 Tax=Mesorhizobium sp. J428 TaxID=2898440 RepID=UPI002151B48F|nr:hypothetical protein [Mesorhizobium sp. J428]MCR5859504.1 hypothetical protein [Mesorhizobium sp. J428]
MNFAEQYIQAERVLLGSSSGLSEKWLQDLIAKDPSILGLGELELRQKERIQPKAGRLDLLLQDADSKRRYEVEIQLGSTDETHIIRTIEYWDIERKRYPQYDHCAVIIAEDITSRFLNVISLFNGAIPLIAIQVQAFRVGGHFTVMFTRVVDELSRGLVDEDEDAEAQPADRSYWENRASKITIGAIDSLLNYAKEIDGVLSLRYNKYYIGITKSDQAFNFISFRPKKNFLRLEVKLPKSQDVDDHIDQAGFDVMDYDSRWSLYRIRLKPDEVQTKATAIRHLIRLAYERWAA